MGSLPSKRKQIANQTSPQLNTWYSQSNSVNLPVVNSPIVVAVSDFPSRDTEPVLRMGEQLSLVSEEGEWCQVKSVATGQECCVPSNSIVKISHRWLYDGIDRAKAEELLLLPANQEGSFIIRKRQAKKGCYSLSIRCTNHESWNCVKHYRINCLENSWLYISPSLTFPSLHELVDYYSGNYFLKLIKGNYAFFSVSDCVNLSLSLYMCVLKKKKRQNCFTACWPLGKNFTPLEMAKDLYYKDHTFPLVTNIWENLLCPVTIPTFQKPTVRGNFEVHGGRLFFSSSHVISY
ncbi:src-like-adapter 2 isoform X1 [Crotalus tigris]|uniref:src-like-adapter 2 isoform X1 n=1 Tax=Crotalus tigris TaxID=88082 RepID=UPI00192FB195|nr:src-like-adapter 2 isoform X1 [Crotalus tigris]XP_039175045.1 src-like-adapter 2 isoform X1 [Crotalus tigris]